jgi:hypothetical protein
MADNPYPPPAVEKVAVERTDARVGFGSKLGTGAAAVAILIPAVGELADATEPLGVPPITWVISSAVLASLVIIGRYGQAFIDRWRAGD